MNSKEKNWLTQREACRRATIGRDTLLKWVAAGLVRKWTVPCTANGRRYSREDIDNVIQRNTSRINIKEKDTKLELKPRLSA